MKNIFKKIASALNVNGRDLTAFLVSLLLAFSLWMFYNLSLRYQEYLTVPIIAKCNIVGHSSQSVNTCDVVARGRATGYSIVRINEISKKHPVTIPFSKMYPAGGETYYVTVNDVQEYTHLIFGENTSIEYFLTDTLFFRFPYETCKTVAVRAVHELDYKPQYTIVGKMNVSPDSVTIYGEPYKLEKIDYVYTEPVKKSNVDSDISGVSRLEKIKDIRFSEESVRYSATVERYVEISESMPVGVRNVPNDKQMMVYPSTARVKFRCRFPYKVNPADSVVFYVDYKDFLESRSGKCVVSSEGAPDDMIDYDIVPEVFECVVNDRY